MYHHGVADVLKGAQLSEFCTSHAGDYKNTGKLQLPTPSRGYTPVTDRLLIPSANRIVQKSDWTGATIPVIVIPIIWEAGRLMKLLQTVDVPVQRIIIVQNSIKLGSKYTNENRAMADVAAVCRDVMNHFTDSSEFLHIHQPGRNLGFGGSMNYGIMSTATWADWWFLLNAGIT